MARPIRTAIWKVATPPERLPEASLPSERVMEEMNVAAPRLLSEEWMLIGRQEDTGLGGRVDLLAVAPDGAVVLIELKRDRTPREVVAQALDYASWVSDLDADEVAAIYRRFAPGRSLADDFRERFGQELDEDALNQSHQIVVVAAALDDSTERIIGYLTERGIAINALLFQVFAYGGEQLISRAWLIDPVRAQVSSATTAGDPNEPWNGGFYGSFGHGESRSWRDAVEYGFICAGGGSWYSRTLRLLGPGDRVWVRVPGSGFVDVGRVTGRVRSAADFVVTTPDADVPVLEVARRANHHRECADDPERSEYFVPVRWLQTVSLEGVVDEVGRSATRTPSANPRRRGGDRHLEIKRTLRPHRSVLAGPQEPIK